MILDPSPGRVTRPEPHDPWSRPLRSAITLALVLAAALAFLSLRAMVRRQTEADWQTLLSTLAEDRRTEVRGRLHEAVADLRTVAGYPTTLHLLRGSAGPTGTGIGDAEHLADLLRGAASAAGMSGIWVSGLGGGLVAGTGPMAPEDSIPDLARAAAVADGPRSTLRGPTVWTAVPVRFADGTAGGAVVSATPAETVFASLHQDLPPHGRSLRVQLVRQVEGAIILVDPGAMDARPTILTIPPAMDRIRVTLPPEAVHHRLVSPQGVPVAASFVGLDELDWGLVVSADQAEIMAAANARFVPQAAMVAGLLLGGLGLAFGLFRARHARLHASLATHASRMAALLEQANDAVLFVGANGRILDWNARAAEFYGYPDGRPPGLSVTDLRAPETREGAADQLRHCFASPALIFETTQRHRDGTLLPVEVSTRRIDTDGATTLVAVIRDLRPRLHQEQVRRQGETEFRALFERSSYPMWAYDDASACLVAVNDAALARLETTREALLGRPQPGLLGVRPGTGGPTDVVRIVTRPDRVTILHVTRHPIEFNGRPATMVVGEDVTEAAAAERERARLSAAITQAAEGVIITDLAGNIVYVNPAFERMTGYGREEVLGQNPRLLKSGAQDRDFYHRLWDHLRRGEVFACRMRNRRKDGRMYLAECVLSPVRDADGQVVNYVGLQRDVTAEVQLAEQLRQAQKMEAVGQLTSGIAHDFNNILSIILGNTELLLETPAGLEAARDLQEVVAAARRGRDMVRKLMAFSRNDPLTLMPISPGTVVQEVAATLRRLLPESIVVVTDVAAGLPSILGDRAALEQIFLNLATNARDAMAEGGQLTLRVRRTIRAASGASLGWSGPAIRVEVSDTGTGIDPLTLARIFEPFFTTKPKGHGTGLGMAMVYGLMKQHDGWVDVMSEVGRGTTVTLDFPEAGASPGLPAGPNGRAGSRAEGHGELVLVVEDEEPLRRVAVRVLERLGYRALAAGNGEEALQVFDRRQDEIALVLSDLVMPVMGGADLLRTLRARGAAVPFILASGYLGAAQRDAGMAGGVTAFLEKPWTLDGIAETVHETLQRASPPSA